MLAVIIPTAWLAIALFFLGLCRMAARGDESLAARGPSPVKELPAPRRVTLSAPAGRPRRRYSPAPSRSTGARAASRLPLRAAHGTRQHP
jgi:hypothetical protein